MRKNVGVVDSVQKKLSKALDSMTILADEGKTVFGQSDGDLTEQYGSLWAVYSALPNGEALLEENKEMMQLLGSNFSQEAKMRFLTSDNMYDRKNDILAAYEEAVYKTCSIKSNGQITSSQSKDLIFKNQSTSSFDAKEIWSKMHTAIDPDDLPDEYVKDFDTLFMYSIESGECADKNNDVLKLALEFSSIAKDDSVYDKETRKTIENQSDTIVHSLSESENYDINQLPEDKKMQSIYLNSLASSHLFQSEMKRYYKGRHENPTKNKKPNVSDVSTKGAGIVSHLSYNRDDFSLKFVQNFEKLHSKQNDATKTDHHLDMDRDDGLAL